MTERRARPVPEQRRPSSPRALGELLRELDIRPPGRVRFHLISRWAAKHVWRVDAAGQPWAYIRTLLGPGTQYPDRWRHLRLGEVLHEARVGPRILGMTAASEALGGRAAMVEAALQPITREALESRADEALALLARLHGSRAVTSALSADVTETERKRIRPLQALLEETRERWFEAVTARWLEDGLAQIAPLTDVVGTLINQIEADPCCSRDFHILVPTHGDANHGNFTTNRHGALRLIDFEDLAFNTPVADLGVFLTWYVDPERHRSLLVNYTLAEPDDILEQMRAWMPLRYLGITAHWAARLTRTTNSDRWAFAVDSIDEWVRGAAELVAGGHVPPATDAALAAVREGLVAEGRQRFGERAGQGE